MPIEIKLNSIEERTASSTTCNEDEYPEIIQYSGEIHTQHELDQRKELQINFYKNRLNDHRTDLPKRRGKSAIQLTAIY